MIWVRKEVGQVGVHAASGGENMRCGAAKDDTRRGTTGLVVLAGGRVDVSGSLNYVGVGGGTAEGGGAVDCGGTGMTTGSAEVGGMFQTVLGV